MTFILFELLPVIFGGEVVVGGGGGVVVGGGGGVVVGGGGVEVVGTVGKTQEHVDSSIT